MSNLLYFYLITYPHIIHYNDEHIVCLVLSPTHKTALGHFLFFYGIHSVRLGSLGHTWLLVVWNQPPQENKEDLFCPRSTNVWTHFLQVRKWFASGPRCTWWPTDHPCHSMMYFISHVSWLTDKYRLFTHVAAVVPNPLHSSRVQVCQ